GIGRINQVLHEIFSDRIRATIWTDIEGQPQGIAESTISMARLAFPAVDFLTLYDAKVVSQSTDLATVDLQPVDMRLPGLQRVPLRIGLPGTKVQFSSGAIVRLGWDRGNPQFPYACLWNGGETVQKVEIAGTT